LCKCGGGGGGGGGETRAQELSFPLDLCCSLFTASKEKGGQKAKDKHGARALFLTLSAFFGNKIYQQTQTTEFIFFKNTISVDNYLFIFLCIFIL